MDNVNFTDFSDLAADTLSALTLHPAKVKTTVTVEGETILVHLLAPRSEIAMVVGKQGATAAALHRVLSCVARNWGHEGNVRLAWDPSDA